MNDSVTCNEIQAQLALFVGDDLDPAASGRIQRHLVGCTTCDGELARLATSRSRIASLRELTADAAPSVWSNVRAELAREGRLIESSAPRNIAVRRPWQFARWSGLTAAAAALVAMAFWVGHGSDSIVSNPNGVASPLNHVPVQLVSNGLRKARPDEAPLLIGAEHLDDRLRGTGRSLDPNSSQLGLAHYEEMR